MKGWLKFKQEKYWTDYDDNDGHEVMKITHWTLWDRWTNKRQKLSLKTYYILYMLLVATTMSQSKFTWTKLSLLWCLTPLWIIFQLYRVAVRFIGGETGGLG